MWWRFWESKEKRHQRQKQRQINRDKRQRDRRWSGDGRKSPNDNRRGGYGRPVAAGPDFGGTISMGPMLAVREANRPRPVSPMRLPQSSMPSITEPPLEIVDTPITNRGFSRPRITVGATQSFEGNLFSPNSYEIVTSERFEAFISPIVNYLRLNKNIRIQIRIKTNVPFNERVDGINDLSQVAINRRAWELQRYLMRTYGLPETQITWDNDKGNNYKSTLGQKRMSTEFKIIE
ncbi:hypothetical protein CDL62_05545 [Alkalitalea saponilacus]|uniref:Uncharacterized protein n=2 Tax=Alkalitalea saponilacus TaxID=889453 RepID=A0A1T5ANV4_9BACT|nr:hypothetical protein CDL62_05545 [Alkalitalea saponilacus]SKB36638.1 hypothetical protein SAMN03080601_00331 [Alkalitalea saponilacus]